MTAIVVPFPRTRDRRFVLRHALRMTELAPPTAEKHLAYQLDLQCQVMAKRGIAPALIAEHRQALETAIRCELWRLVIFRDGAA